VYKGLAIGQTPASDREYGELVRKYLADPAFRELVHEVADAMELVLLESVSEERGLLLAPASQESRFAWRLMDIRQNSMEEHEKAMLLLAHLAIVASFFPTAESLEEANTLYYPVKFASVRDRVLGMASRFAKADAYTGRAASRYAFVGGSSQARLLAAPGGGLCKASRKGHRKG
jgi:hypothetical protein